MLIARVLRLARARRRQHRGDRDWPWTIQSHLTSDLVNEILRYGVKHALPIARNHFDSESTWSFTGSY